MLTIIVTLKAIFKEKYNDLNYNLEMGTMMNGIKYIYDFHFISYLQHILIIAC